MYKKIKSIKNNHALLSLLISILVVFFLWGIFFAQYVLSDGVTFAKNGDEMRQTFPAFIEMGNLISEGIIDGVDITTVNGSNSIHMNGVEWYIPYRIFAYLGKLFNPLLMFIVFFMLHTFLNMYFTQRLCYVYFKMRPALALVIALSNLAVGFRGVNFVAFYVIESLVIPLIYGVICMLKSNSKAFCIFSSLFFVLALTSGYVTLSCILALVVFLLSMVYAIAYKINDKKSIVYRLFSSAILGLGISIPYLLTLFLNNVNADVKRMTSLSMATALSSKVTDVLPRAVFFSDQANSIGIIMWIGTIWTFLTVVFVTIKVNSKMAKGEKIIFWLGILFNVTFFLIDLGQVLPLEKWFYIIPIFGGMHDRNRYFLILTPLLFLSFGIALQKLEKQTKKKIIIWVSIIYVLLLISMFLLAINDIDKDAFVIELVLTGVAIYFGIVNGFVSRKFLLIFSFIMLCYNANILYTREELTISNSTIKNRCIAYDGEKQALFDSFVENLPKQEIYKYVAVEGGGSDIPAYIPGNYGWYHRQKNLLSNYLKYPLHARSVSDSYREVFNAGWYDSFEVNYLCDTRADFAILTQEALEKKPNNYNLSVNAQRLYLNDTLFCTKLEKYVPRHYTGGEEQVKDENDSLDNGYFYCPALTNDSIQNFVSDGRSYFRITIDATTNTELQYSMFPNKNYLYYIDGEEYKPKFDYGLAYFELASGQHCVEIVYKDMIQIVVFWVFNIYYLMILIVGIFCFSHFCIRKKNNKYYSRKGNCK